MRCADVGIWGITGVNWVGCGILSWLTGLGIYLLWCASAESRREIEEAGFGGSAGVRELSTLKDFGCYFQFNFNILLVLKCLCKRRYSTILGGGTGLVITSKSAETR
jgi:hypothetical protein